MDKITKSKNTSGEVDRMDLSYLSTIKAVGSGSLKYQTFTLESRFYINYIIIYIYYISFPECSAECITDQFVNALK